MQAKSELETSTFFSLALLRLKPKRIAESTISIKTY